MVVPVVQLALAEHVVGVGGSIPRDVHSRYVRRKGDLIRGSREYDLAFEVEVPAFELDLLVDLIEDLLGQDDVVRGTREIVHRCFADRGEHHVDGLQARCEDRISHLQGWICVG